MASAGGDPEARVRSLEEKLQAEKDRCKQMDRTVTRLRNLNAAGDKELRRVSEILTKSQNARALSDAIREKDEMASSNKMLQDLIRTTSEEAEEHRQSGRRLQDEVDGLKKRISSL